jgi:broad specificity phosphatase PhoE
LNIIFSKPYAIIGGMKWPETLTLVRHDTSAYNALKSVKEESPLYSTFKKLYEENPESPETLRLALEIKDSFALNFGDHDTPLATDIGEQARITGSKLRNLIKLPDIVFVSPFLRTHMTLDKLAEGWPELGGVETKEEERLREQDHGLALIYNDWRVFNTLHPEQRELRSIQGEYWYRYPQGDNVPDVRERLRSWLGTVTRDYAERSILTVTHHLTILSIRANLERLDEKEFIRLDHEEKPINSGVTIYKGHPELGSNGKLILEAYNLKLY